MSTDYEGNQKRAAAELDSNGYHATDGHDGSPPFKKCRRGEVRIYVSYSLVLYLTSSPHPDL